MVYFKTTKVDFEVKLFGKDNPVTVSNFLENIENNIYENKKFYKIINYPKIRFIHGGVNQENKSYLRIIYYFIKFLIYVNIIVYVFQKV